MKNKRLIGIILTVALLLLIPLIAMQVTDEVNWTRSDFVKIGFLLLSTGLLCELIIRKVNKIPIHYLWSYFNRVLPDLYRTCSWTIRDSLCRILKNVHPLLNLIAL